MKQSEDRRVLRTRQQCMEALISLIQEKGFDALTVQDIIDRANIGRSTFYSHFEGKEDLLLRGLDQLRFSLQEAQRQAHKGQGKAEERAFVFSHELFAHAHEHRRVFSAMVGRHGGALVQQHFQRMLVDLVREDVKAVAPKDPKALIPQEAIVQYVAGGLWGMLAWWMDGRMRMSVEEVNALFRRLAIPVLAEAMSARIK